MDPHAHVGSLPPQGEQALLEAAGKRHTLPATLETVQWGWLRRLQEMQQEVDWGRREMPEEMRERLRQYLAGRSELVTGDRMVMASLQARARERQRWLLGLPLVLFGLAGAVVFVRLRGRRS